MWPSRKNLLISVIVAYAFLLLSYFLLKEKKIINLPCDYDTPCVRFCCDDTVKVCTDDFIRKNFKSNFSHFDDENYVILHGAPKCNLRNLGSNLRTSMFNRGSVVLYDMDDRGIQFEENHYCFKDTQVDDKVEFTLMLCDFNAKYHTFVLYSSLIVMFLFFAATVYSYVASDQIRTASGRSFVIFIVALTLVLMFFPIIAADAQFMRKTAETLVTTGFAFAFMWFNVLIFDIFWTFKNFRAPNDPLHMFKTYCVYGFGLPILAFLLLLIIETFEIPMYWILRNVWACFFLFSVSADIVLLLITGFLIFRISKTSKVSEQFQVKVEKERFWSYVALLGIIVILCFLEIQAWREFDDSTFAHNAIKILSAFAIFGVFVYGKKLSDDSDGSPSLFKNQMGA